MCTTCADGSFSYVGENFCKVLTCAANSAGKIIVILAPNVSVRITNGNRLDSPNTCCEQGLSPLLEVIDGRFCYWAL